MTWCNTVFWKGQPLGFGWEMLQSTLAKGTCTDLYIQNGHVLLAMMCKNHC